MKQHIECVRGETVDFFNFMKCMLTSQARWPCFIGYCKLGHVRRPSSEPNSSFNNSEHHFRFIKTARRIF